MRKCRLLFGFLILIEGLGDQLVVGNKLVGLELVDIGLGLVGIEVGLVGIGVEHIEVEHRWYWFEQQRWVVRHFVFECSLREC